MKTAIVFRCDTFRQSLEHNLVPPQNRITCRHVWHWREAYRSRHFL